MKLTTTSNSLLISFSADEAAKIIADALGLPSFAKVTISRTRKAKVAAQPAPAPAPEPKVRDVFGTELNKLIIAVDTHFNRGETEAGEAIIRNATGYSQAECAEIFGEWREYRLAWHMLNRSLRPSAIPAN